MPTHYELSTKERAVLQSLNMAALDAKARMFDLQSQLDQARSELLALQQKFSGAFAVLAEAHGMSAASAQLSPDFARIMVQRGTK